LPAQCLHVREAFKKLCQLRFNRLLSYLLRRLTDQVVQPEVAPDRRSRWMVSLFAGFRLRQSDSQLKPSPPSIFRLNSSVHHIRL
jgi:hypothetical protein